MRELDIWFCENRRSFPWREKIDPYRVWISEVMLQQTRAQAVVPYFERWMERFPDVATLAAAPLDAVIKCWEGLGYYSRARNLHAGAKQIRDEWGGKIPSQREELLKIRGLGPYTSAAIASFGFHQRAAPVDGNVLRVLSRYFAVEEEIGRSETRRKVEELAEGLLDEKKPWVTAEALIELGATVCSPKPRCADCPIRSGCKAALQGSPERYPNKKTGVVIETLRRGVAVVEAEGAVLIRKNPPGKVMADLYEFIYFEGVQSLRGVVGRLANMLGQGPELIEKLDLVIHTFTRYKVHLYPAHFRIARKVSCEGCEWVAIEELNRLPFSSGHRKILAGRCNYWQRYGFLVGYEHSPS